MNKPIFDHLLQCCRCKNKHKESERVNKRIGKGHWSSRCHAHSIIVLEDMLEAVKVGTAVHH